MQKEKVQSSTTRGRKELATEFQKDLGDAIVLLLDLKAREGITQCTKVEIDKTVEKLQQMIRNIPDIAAYPPFLDMVSELVKRLFSVRKRLRGD